MECEYDEKVLRRLQLAQVGILEDVDAFCAQKGLTYFVLGGCLIGAFRHQGFIPWDDDIDLGMSRADYEMFLKVAREDKAFSAKYRVIDPLYDENCPFMFAKISKRGTVCQSEEMVECGCETGIHLDLFPFDYTTSDQKLRSRQIRQAWWQQRLSYIYYLKHPHLPIGGFMGRAAGIACLMLHYLMRLFRVNPRKIAVKYRKIATRYQGDSSGGMTMFSALQPEKFYRQENEVYPVERVPFEYTTICVPREHEALLQRVWGDYRQLPPEDQRHNHGAAVLDFGDETT